MPKARTVTSIWASVKYDNRERYERGGLSAPQDTFIERFNRCRTKILHA